MGMPLKYIGQAAMDNFLQNYRTSSDFWTLDDFILRAATTIADYYQKVYDQQYAMLRNDKTDEIVAFPTEILSEQVLEVEKKDGEAFVTLLAPQMSFMGDNQTSGIQEVVSIKPRGVQLERSNISEGWQNKLLPFTGRIFWSVEGERIVFFKKGFCNIGLIKLYYVPAIMKRNGELLQDAIIADGVADMAINATVAKMKQLSTGTVVKESNDGNSNKTMESEINKEAVKP